MLREGSSRDVVNVFEDFEVGKGEFLSEYLVLIIGEVGGYLLLEVLDVDEVAVVVGSLGQEGGDVEGASVGPAVEHPLADVHVPPLLE